MPPQKNAGAKASKRVSGVQSKNARFIQSFVSDLRTGDEVTDVYISRVTARLGNGRMMVFYMDSENRPQIVQTVIRGTFRGKAKRSVWIDVGSIVVIAHSGISGSASFEIMAILSDDEIKEIRKLKTIDARIFDSNILDKDVLLSDNPTESGFEFETAEVMDDDEIDNI